MSFGGGEIYQAALCEKIDSAVPREQILFAICTNSALGCHALFEFGNVNFAIVVARVTDDRAIFQTIEMPPDDHVLSRPSR